MEKRVLVAVLLSIAVMYGFSYFFPQGPPKPAVQAPVQKGVSTASQAVVAQSVTAEQAGALVSVPSGQAPEREILVETDLYRAVFSTHGAALKRLSLKKYRENATSSSPEIALIDSLSPKTLVNSSEGFEIDPSASYATTSSQVTLTGSQKQDIEFVWTSAHGLQVRKIYTVTGNGYGIELTEKLANAGATPLSGKLKLTLASRVATTSKEGRYEVHGPATLADNSVTSINVADLAKEAKSFDKQVLWTGFGDKYFFSSVTGKEGSLGAVRIAQANPNLIESVISSPQLNIAAGQTAALSYTLYFGPKDLDILKAQGNRLEEVIDFGWFSMLAKPLLRTIKFFYTFTGNYGLAIIIITVILKILFYPLTHTSYKSMKEMQKLQPKMQELKEKFKNDRDAMNRAVMELYQTHKVNPLGGCLPMVVQIPVFFALYKALMFSIELRHAPFYLWIQDLSAKDPYYVTPILMGASMFIQQKMTPTNMDPMQEKMMLMLPVVFTFMFLSFPSGLVLYWLVNNILTIGQQAYINRKIK